MYLEIPYGEQRITFELNDGRVIKIVNPSEISPSSNPTLEIKQSLNNPIQGKKIDELSPKGKTIAIAVDDITRVTPTQTILPPILRSLEDSGANKKNIKIIIALGTHREMTEQEMKNKYGAQIVEEYEVINHAFNNEPELEYIGKIADDVPVWINKDYIKADIRIATGNIIPHCNAGWGAGAKIILPGLAGEETVGRMHVHSGMTTPNGLGMENNPTRKLIDEFAEKVGIHLLVNTAITRNREIVKVFSGHFVKAHREGIKLSKKIYGVEIPSLSDITISSSYPADIEFWQAQKGLFSADLATKKNGGILLTSPCPEGVSVMHPKLLDYMQYSTDELKQIYRDDKEIEDYVALGMAMSIGYVRERHKICIISKGISQKDAKKLGFEKFQSLNEGLKFLSNQYGQDSTINILTMGGETYPILI
jgi:nickel-dependent lactate racemase